jgi:hypothetical protein
MLVGEHPASDSEQPWQRPIGDLVQPPPSDKERLSDRVIDKGGRLAAHYVAADRVVMRGKHCLEPHPTLGVSAHPQPLWPAPAKTLRGEPTRGVNQSELLGRLFGMGVALALPGTTFDSRRVS